MERKDVSSLLDVKMIGQFGAGDAPAKLLVETVFQTGFYHHYVSEIIG